MKKQIIMAMEKLILNSSNKKSVFIFFHSNKINKKINNIKIKKYILKQISSVPIGLSFLLSGSILQQFDILSSIVGNDNTYSGMGLK